MSRQMLHCYGMIVFTKLMRLVWIFCWPHQRCCSNLWPWTWTPSCAWRPMLSSSPWARWWGYRKVTCPSLWWKQCHLMEGNHVLLMSRRWPGTTWPKIHLIQLDPNHFAFQLVQTFIHYNSTKARSGQGACPGHANLMQEWDSCYSYWDDCMVLMALVCKQLGLHCSPITTKHMAKQKSCTYTSTCCANTSCPPGLALLCPLYHPLLASGEPGWHGASYPPSVFPGCHEAEVWVGAMGIKLVKDIQQCHLHFKMITQDLWENTDHLGIGLRWGNAVTAHGVCGRHRPWCWPSTCSLPMGATTGPHVSPTSWRWQPACPPVCHTIVRSSWCVPPAALPGMQPYQQYFQHGVQADSGQAQAHPDQPLHGWLLPAWLDLQDPQFGHNASSSHGGLWHGTPAACLVLWAPHPPGGHHVCGVTAPAGPQVHCQPGDTAGTAQVQHCLPQTSRWQAHLQQEALLQCGLRWPQLPQGLSQGADVCQALGTDSPQYPVAHFLSLQIAPKGPPGMAKTP